eukprot:scaffold2664_cov117-Isochrysis_galbana.AAC.4
MDPGSGTKSRKTQTQTPRGVTVGTLKRGPPLRVRGDRGQPTGAPPPLSHPRFSPCRIRGAANNSPITVTDVQSDGRPRDVPRDPHGALHLRDAAAQKDQVRQLLARRIDAFASNI